MSAYAWYYNDYSNDVCYWSFSNEYSTTMFASIVSSKIGKQISASDTSYVDRASDLERKIKYMSHSVHV